MDVQLTAGVDALCVNDVQLVGAEGHVVSVLLKVDRLRVPHLMRLCPYH